jgi:hypothetical protein
MSVKSNAYPAATPHRKLTQYNNLGKTNCWKPQLKRLYRKCPTMVYHHTMYQLAVVEATSFNSPCKISSTSAPEYHELRHLNIGNFGG